MIALLAMLLHGPAVAGEVEAAQPPLLVEVEAFPRWPARRRLPGIVAEDVTMTPAGRANIDGRLNEPSWKAVKAPPLIPLDSAIRAPKVRFVALSTPDGMAFGLSGEPAEPGWSATLTVDPTGTRTHWLQLDLSDGKAAWKSCSPDPVISEGAGTPPWPTGAMPCTPLEQGRSIAKKGPDGWEILVSWADLPASALSTLRLGFFCRGPDGQGGTWHTGRSATAIPPSGRGIELSNRPSGRLRYDLEAGGATLEVTTKSQEQTGTWTWTALQSGVESASGTVEVNPTDGPNGKGTIFLDDLPYEGAVLAVQQSGEPLAPAVVVFLPRRYFQASPLNPIHDGTVVVALHLLDPYPEAPVIVRDLDGRVLGRTTATLPAGRADLVVAIPRSWPDTVVLEVGGLLDPDTRLLRRGGTARRLASP